MIIFWGFYLFIYLLNYYLQLKKIFMHSIIHILFSHYLPLKIFAFNYMIYKNKTLCFVWYWCFSMNTLLIFLCYFIFWRFFYYSFNDVYFTKCHTCERCVKILTCLFTYGVSSFFFYLHLAKSTQPFSYSLENLFFQN